MISLKLAQTSITVSKHAIFISQKFKSRNSCMFLCKSKDSDSESSKQEGDTRKQDLLARIAMLQAQKVRLTDYLDEKSEYLNQFAEEANAEFDKIGEDAMKDLDEASTRIMESIETRMQAFEESAESSRSEIKQGENKLADFEDQIEKERNEGLFFKNLRENKTVDRTAAMKEAGMIKEVAIETAGSKTRRNIYLALILLVVIGITDSTISPSPDWRKVAVLGAILVGLSTQFFYEQKLLSGAERKSDKE